MTTKETSWSERGITPIGFTSDDITTTTPQGVVYEYQPKTNKITRRQRRYARTDCRGAVYLVCSNTTSTGYDIGMMAFKLRSILKAGKVLQRPLLRCMQEEWVGSTRVAAATRPPCAPYNRQTPPFPQSVDGGGGGLETANDPNKPKPLTGTTKTPRRKKKHAPSSRAEEAPTCQIATIMDSSLGPSCGVDR